MYLENSVSIGILIKNFILHYTLLRQINAKDLHDKSDYVQKKKNLTKTHKLNKFPYFGQCQIVIPS